MFKLSEEGLWVKRKQAVESMVDDVDRGEICVVAGLRYIQNGLTIHLLLEMCIGYFGPWKQ